MKKGIAAVLVLAIVAGAGAGGYYYYWNYWKADTASGDRVSSTSEDAVYVDSVAVLAGLGSGNGLIQRYAGVIEPQQTWEVKQENDRTVKECYVKEGDVVKEGQKLFIYDTTEDEDKLAKAQIDIERCQNEIESSRAQKEQLERDKAKAPADEQLDYTTRILTQENNIKQNEYEYKTQELEISQLKEKIADSAVYCEIDGMVKSINDPNDNNSGYSSESSDTAYITVLQVGDYRVKGTVNEQNKDQIFTGMDVIVHSRVDDKLIWRGSITEINLDKGESNSEASSYGFGFNSDNSSSSTNYPFYVELESSENLILGQHVYLEPDMGQANQKEGIWLDDYYFVTGEDNASYVWAASSANVLEKRRVVLGEYDEELAAWQVTEGLDEDDYILSPFEGLAEGLPVIYNDFSQTGMAPSDTFDLSGEEIDLFDGEDGYYEENEDGVFYDEDQGFDLFDEEEGMEFYDADAEDGPEDADWEDYDEEEDVGEELDGLEDEEEQ